MIFEVKVPQLGPEPEEATLVNWEKEAGDPVEAGDILFELESSKVVSEIEAEQSGSLKRILTPEGGKVMPGTTVAEIQTD